MSNTLLIMSDVLGIADNTIVVYTIDNGLDYNGWLGGGLLQLNTDRVLQDSGIAAKEYHSYVKAG